MNLVVRNILVMLLLVALKASKAQPLAISDIELIQLTEGTKNIKNPVFSFDSNCLYFESWTDGQSAIYFIELNQTDSIFELKSYADNFLMPAPHPDNMSMLAVQQQNSMNKLEIFPGSDKKLHKILLRNIEVKNPVFNITGNILCAAGKRDIDKHYQLMTFDFRYDNLNFLTESEQNIEYPKWSANGSKISYHSSNQYGVPDGTIHIIGWDGLNKQLIQHDTLQLSYAGWSKSQNKIVCTASNEKAYWLVEIKINENEFTPLVYSKYPIKNASWSADGTFIAFVIEENKNKSELFLLKRDMDIY